MEEYVSSDDNTAIYAGLIDPSNPKGREEVRSELLDDDLDVEFVSEDTSIDDELRQGIRRAINQEPCRSLAHN